MLQKTSPTRFIRFASSFLPLWVGFLVFPMFPAARDANVPNDAWWNFYTAGLPAATPTTVPENAIAVGHNIAQPDKVAAVGIQLQATRGASVETLKLSLKEADDPGANVGAEGAAVVACPITGPWEPVTNGEWADAPDYDCELGAVTGNRSEDATWTFDLLPLGRQWLDPEFPLEQAGVLLLIEESTQPAQVSFRSVETGEFRLEFAVASAAEPEQPTEPVVVGGLEAPEEPAPARVSQPETAPAPTEPEAVLVTQPAQAQRETIPDADILGNLPWGTWLLVPLVIGAAAAVSYALGPGRSSGARRREGPVSRALARQGEDR